MYICTVTRSNIIVKHEIKVLKHAALVKQPICKYIKTSILAPPLLLTWHLPLWKRPKSIAIGLLARQSILYPYQAPPLPFSDTELSL